MHDLILYPILGIIFLTQDSDPSQDLIPDLDLEISTNQLNIIIVIICHTANNCFRCQNRNFPRRQPNQGRRNNFRNSK